MKARTVPESHRPTPWIDLAEPFLSADLTARIILTLQALLLSFGKGFATLSMRESVHKVSTFCVFG
jgi:hypothetical protein